MLSTTGLRKRMAAACSGSGTRQRHALRLGSRWRRALRSVMMQRRAPRPRSRMAGEGGMTVSRVTEE
jgi:hypothetical protein